MQITFSNNFGDNVCSLCIKFWFYWIFLLGTRSGEGIEYNFIKLFTNLTRNLVIFKFYGVNKHNKEVTGFQLVELVHFHYSFDIGYENWMGSFMRDVDKKRDKKINILRIEWVLGHEIIDYLHCIIWIIEIANTF